MFSDSFLIIKWMLLAFYYKYGTLGVRSQIFLIVQYL